MLARRLIAVCLVLLIAGCMGKQPVSAPIPSAKEESRKVSKPLSKATVAGLVERAKKAADANDYPTAQDLFARAIKADPTHREALLAAALLYEREAMQLSRPASSQPFLKSAEAFRKVRDLGPKLTDQEKLGLAVILYNEACTLAINGEFARALKALSESVDAGFSGFELLDNDRELDPLRKFPEFQEIQRRVENHHVAAMLAEPPSFAFDFRLKNLDGAPVSLADFRGKVVIVQLWGTWCPPARKEVPYLVQLYKTFHDKGLEVVGLNYEIDEGDEVRKALQVYIKNMGIPFPCLIGDDATRTRVSGFEGFPTTLFLDRKGKVRLKLSGYQPLSAFEAAVNALLGETKAKP